MAADFSVRRREILCAGLGVAAPLWSWSSGTVLTHPREVLCSGRIRQTENGVRYELASLEILPGGQLREISVIGLPSRAHGIISAGLPGEAIVCARRPGAWLMRVRVSDGTILAQYDNDDQRWLQGHACLSADGKHVFAGEVDLQERATIGVFDAKTLRRVSEVPSFGIEPHELIVIDNSTLLVAHGGRRNTLRESELILNNPRCESSLSWVNTNTGRVVHELHPQDKRISLRHLAKVSRSTCVVGAQAAMAETLPMAALVDGGRGLNWLHSAAKTDNYVASVVANPRSICATFPHSNIVMQWTANGQPQSARQIACASGAAMVGESLWTSTEEGKIISDHCVIQQRFPGAIWDNHMQLIALT